MFFSRARVLLTFRDGSLLRDRGLSCFSCVLTLLVSYANAVSPANDDVSTSPRTYLHPHLRMRSMYKVSIWMYVNINWFPHVLNNRPCETHPVWHDRMWTYLNMDSRAYDSKASIWSLIITVADMRVEGATVGLGTAEVKSISYKQRIHRLGFSNRQV